MKKAVCIIICMMFFMLAGCTAAQNTSSAAKEQDLPPDIKDYFVVGANPDYTYNFKVYTRSGAAIISEENYSMKPSAEFLSKNVIKLWAGEGESTQWVRYCDIDAKIVSDVFYGVVGEYEDNTVYTEFRDGAHYIIVKDFFGTKSFVREFLLENAAVDADPKAEIIQKDGKYSISVTYLSGLKKEPKNVVFEIN